VLRNAEDLMKQGKYLSALDQYMLAERVAPNNPLVGLGRAHSELAGAYYRRAEQDLRQALTHDPTLMMGQYDLKAMIGQERLETLVKDLKDVAKRQEKDPGPVFLLAYLAYNTGSQSSAAMYLDEAEKRAGGRDNFYRLVRSHWTLGGEQTAGAGATVSTMALSDVLKQFEEGNVLSATLSKTELSGAFRNTVSAEGGKASTKTFRTQLPPGAASGPLGKWIQEHRQGAEVKIETGEATTQPSQ
jgi:tetratricopeptide (TPR) repeat protein